MVNPTTEGICDVSHIVLIVEPWISPDQSFLTWMLDLSSALDRANAEHLADGVPRRFAYQAQEHESIQATAESLVIEVNDSLDLASVSTNVKKRTQYLAHACAKITQLQRMCLQHYFLKLAGLKAVQLQIAQIQNETVALSCRPGPKKESQRRPWKKQRKAQADPAGTELEFDEPPGESLKDLGLAFVTQKIESFDDEIRVLKEALKKIPESNRKHFDWIRARLKELEERIRASKSTT